MARDFLDTIIAKRTARNPQFPQLVQDAIARQDHAQRRVRMILDAPVSQEEVPQPVQDQEDEPGRAERAMHKPPI